MTRARGFTLLELLLAVTLVGVLNADQSLFSTDFRTQVNPQFFDSANQRFYATSNRGACHLRGYTVASEVLGIPVKTDPLVADGKPELVKAFQDATATFDSAGICIFTSFAWGLADVQPQVAAACGEEFTHEMRQREPALGRHGVETRREVAGEAGRPGAGRAH